MDVHRRLVELVDFYDEHDEIDKQSLLDEMEQLGGRAEAASMARSGNAEERFIAARLMHLLPDQSYLATLPALVRDPDGDVAAAAQRALWAQRRTAAWFDVVREAAADQARPELARVAGEWLAED